MARGDTGPLRLAVGLGCGGRGCAGAGGSTGAASGAGGRTGLDVIWLGGGATLPLMCGGTYLQIHKVYFVCKQGKIIQFSSQNEACAWINARSQFMPRTVRNFL